MHGLLAAPTFDYADPYDAQINEGRFAAVSISTAVDVSIVLAVYNEAPHLTAELTRIRDSMSASAYSWELIVVDDGSDDGSAAIASADPDTRVIFCGRRGGVGAARRLGTEAAHGQIVVWSDADMSYPNHQIPELLDAMADADHIVGSRTSEQGTLKLLRVPVKWAIRRFASYIAATPIPDLNSGFRAFRRDLALGYIRQVPDGFSCVTTLTMRFVLNGHQMRFIPIEYQKRAGRSKFNPVIDTGRQVALLLRIALAHDPARLAAPGLWLLASLGGLAGAKLVRSVSSARIKGRHVEE